LGTIKKEKKDIKCLGWYADLIDFARARKSRA